MHLYVHVLANLYEGIRMERVCLAHSIGIMCAMNFAFYLWTVVVNFERFYQCLIPSIYNVRWDCSSVTLTNSMLRS